jgi:hypothetical protein
MGMSKLKRHFQSIRNTIRLWHVDRSKGLDFLCKEIKVPDKILLIAFNMAALYGSKTTQCFTELLPGPCAGN